MPLIAIASASGAPGVTCTALALGGMWPEPARPVVVEADVKGGDLALRFELSQRPGLLSWASQARRGAASSLLPHAQPLPGGLLALPAPPGHQATTAALDLLTRHDHIRTLWHAGGAVADDGGDGGNAAEVAVLADLGRLGPESAIQHALLGAADVVVLVCQGSQEYFAHIVSRIDELRPLVGERLRVIVIGASPYGNAEISSALQADCLYLPVATVEILDYLGMPVHRGRRHLREAARDVAEQLAVLAADPGQAAAPEDSGGERR